MPRRPRRSTMLHGTNYHKGATTTREVQGVGRRRLGAWWFVAAMAVPTVAAGTVAFMNHLDMESDLAQRSRAALEQAGFKVSSISFDGRDGDVSVTAGDSAKVQQIVADQPGVRVARVSGSVATGQSQGENGAPAGSADQGSSGQSSSASCNAAQGSGDQNDGKPCPIGQSPGAEAAATPAVTSSPATAAAPSTSTPAAPAAAPQPSGSLAGVNLTAAGGGVVVRAEAKDETEKAALLGAVRARLGDTKVIDEVSVNPAAPARDHAAVAAIASLVKDPGVSVVGQNDSVALTGNVPAEETKATIEREVRKVVGDQTRIDNRLTMGGAATPQPTNPDQPASPDQADPAVLCKSVNEDVKKILAEQQVRFTLNGTKVAPASNATLERIAQRLKPCVAPAIPGTKVTVEGHASADGNRDVNTQLSQQRAEAVRAALIRFGVPAEAAIARGFGDSRPIAPNNTEAGRAANRRVEVVVQKGTP